MSDTIILQARLDGQKTIKDDIKCVEEKVDKNSGRIDRLELQLVSLEDDALTVKEFDKLEKTVGNLETQVSSN